MANNINWVKLNSKYVHQSFNKNACCSKCKLDNLSEIFIYNSSNVICVECVLKYTNSYLSFENNIDYSDKNTEFDANDFENQKYSIKLEFTEDDYTFVKDKLQQLNQSPEKILYNALISL